MSVCPPACLSTNFKNNEFLEIIKARKLGLSMQILEIPQGKFICTECRIILY